MVSCVVKKNLQITKSRDSNEMWVLFAISGVAGFVALRTPVVVSTYILRIEREGRFVQN